MAAWLLDLEWQVVLGERTVDRAALAAKARAGGNQGCQSARQNVAGEPGETEFVINRLDWVAGVLLVAKVLQPFRFVDDCRRYRTPGCP